MIDYTHADLFLKDNTKKELLLDFGEFQIGNSKLYSESFELSESLCTQNELRFGCCEASVLKFKCRNEFGELKSKQFNVSMVLNGNADEPFRIGSYKVFSDEPSGDRKYKNVTAYDAMYDVINADMTAWYNDLAFPKSLKDFRNDFFRYLGIEQVEQTLINDDIQIEKTIDTNKISGKQIITAICEINGVFGHIDRKGLFDYVSLPDKTRQVLYPSAKLYPSEKLFPVKTPYNSNYGTEYVKANRYSSCTYTDYNTRFISKLQIRQDENDIGTIVGDGSNTYIIEDNFLLYGKNQAELEDIASTLFRKINQIQYRPFKASLRGNPCLEVGDAVIFYTKYKSVESYILERTIKGIQALKDSFESNGVFEYSEKLNSTNRDIKQLKGKTNKLERTVDMLNSEINDEEKGLKSQIKQTTESISTKVSKNEVVSEINQSAEEIKIKGEKIALEGVVTANDSFKILLDGSMRATDGYFEGSLVTSDATITGGTVNIRTADEKSSAIVLTYAEEQLDLRPSEILLNAYDLGTQTVLSSFAFAIGTRSNPYVDISGADMEVNVDFVVHGSKNRVVKTKSYDTRKLYCYEMASPIFGDVGHGVIGADGLCYVDVDQVLLETIDTNQSYQVFLQSYSQHNVYVLERQSQYFIVKGEPHTEFDWELKAKQLDFSIERLDTYSKEKFKDEDYVGLASEYLRAYEQEVLDYEH